jgi:predicted cupin superfamily sugar epimerase
MKTSARPPLAEALDLLPHPEGGWYRETWKTWLWHRGGPLTLILGGHEGQPSSTTILGPAVEEGQAPQVLVPAGTWQAARPAGDEGVLVSCVVSPGFDFADFRML